MHEFITQPIPGGFLTPQSQVDEALSIILTAAEHVEFCALTELENRLGELYEHLVLLASAGALAGISFQLEDEEGVYGVQVLIDLYGVEECEEVDLSTLRLLASPQACGQLTIVCTDPTFVEGLTGAQWLPDATDTLTVTLAYSTDNDAVEDFDQEDSEQREEARDDDDNDVEAWREPTGEIDDLYQ